MSVRLSKSRFQKGLQCERALWLAVHRRDLAAPCSEAQQWVFDQGTAIGRLAHALFPGGIEVTEDHRHAGEALATTRALLADGTPVLYEAAFEHRSAFCRVDILAATGDGRWDLYEVKSSGSAKPEHVTDAAVQAFAVEGSGLRLRRIGIVHLDTSYVYPGGAHDPWALFAVADVTAEVRGFISEIPGMLERFAAVVSGTEPTECIGQRCGRPYACEFREYCHAFLPAEHPVTDLPRLHDATLRTLLDAGMTSIYDIPEAFAGLTPAQARVVAAVRGGKPEVDARALARALAALEWPVYHLDFETVMPALPLWRGTRPYETVPFQYSVHVQRRDGTLEHRRYLHDGTDDPRPALAERLLADLGASGSIVHYTPYERSRLEDLGRSLPHLIPALATVRDRLFDLEPVIKRHTLHPASGGRTSIKHVLPAWCPDCSYEGLAIADGQTASIRYLRVVTGVADAEEAEETMRALEEYCALDTFAMARLLTEMALLETPG